MTELRELDGALRSFISSRVPADDAEDLLQECYLRVGRRLAELRDRDRLSAWVFRIARNVLVDWLRSRGGPSGHRIEPLEDEVVDGATSEPEGELRVGRWLGTMIDRLPESYATVLRESELEGRLHREIAERHGLSVSGVKSRVQRGRILLRDKLSACCRFELDRRGGVVGLERRDPDDPSCCGPDDDC